MDDPKNLSLGDRLTLLFEAGVNIGPILQAILDGDPPKLEPMTLEQWHEAQERARSQPPKAPIRRPSVPGVDHPWIAANQATSEPFSPEPKGGL